MQNLGIVKIQADELVTKYVSDPITKFHFLESEAIM